MKANNKEYNNKAVEPLQVFDYAENAPVRVQVINGETWFVAKDVCRILGIINHKDAISKTLDDDERGVATIYPRSSNGVVQRRDVNVINESGLYSLVFHSRKPDAKKFRKWVTGEVLPSIRRTGGYGMAGGVCRCGVEGMLYRGMRLFPYRELLKALGMSARSGSACRRRRMWPAFFVRAFGRDFVTEQLADLLEDERRVQRRREAMRGWQLELEFKAGCDPGRTGSTAH